MSEPLNAATPGRRRVMAGPSRSATAALRILQTCPLLPVDAFRYLAGFRSTGGAHGRLEKLRQAGLADVQRVDLGYLVSDRPIGLWEITEEGLRALNGATAEPLAHGNGTRLHAPPARRWRRAHRSTKLATRVAAYQLLAYLVGQWQRDGQLVDLSTCEHPWVRSVRSPAGAMLRVQLPAIAVLALREICEEGDTAGGQRITIVLVPDLGAAPVARYREMLRRLLAYREGSDEDELEVVVATMDSHKDGTRVRAWQSLLKRFACGQEGLAISSRVVTWLEVHSLLSLRPHRADWAGEVQRGEHRGDGATTWRLERAPVRAREQLLHLVGRHPFLTSVQLAQLLGTTAAQIRRLEADMVTRGWLRHVELDDVHPCAIGLSRTEISGLGLVEITVAGRRRLASWLGLDSTTAARYHGLIGDVLSSRGRRGRLLRNLAHTLGVNSVFVAFAVAAETVHRAGGTDRFAQWRGAAACERGHCKPDGYGCYVREGLKHGFFLEYDRGTEPARKYRSKLHAYYRYRDSGAASRDYDGFPALLFVTTQAGAEWRIAEEAHRIEFTRSTEPLPILITSTDRITGHAEGVLGPIWRTPGNKAEVERRYWLTGGPPRGRFGQPSSSIPTPRLSWPTARDARRQRGRCVLSERQDGLL